jgi:Cu/Ag efflux protein CusF
MKRIAAALFITLAFSAVYAEDAHHAAARVAQASEPLSEGEVRKVDRDAQKITIKHGPLANLDMPAMTMVFQVKDPALLDQAKAGDKVKFRAEKAGAAYFVTQIETAR